MRKIINIFASMLMLLGLAVGAKAQGTVIIKAKLDSTVLLMGKQTALHIELSQDKNAVGHFVGESAPNLTDMVEVADRPKADTTDLGNNRIQINRDLIIQSFDSGVYMIPPQQYVIGRDTFKSNPVTLKVLPVKVDSMTTVHDYKPVAEVPFKLLDFLPSFIADYWWIYLLVLLVLAISVFVYFKWLKKGRIPLMPQKKELPPYEEAIMSLENLKQRQLWQSGQDKEYYTALTDILRKYIYRRFDINAVEMTSSQIMDVLKKNEETRAVNEQLSMILEIADFVKFAKVRPLPDDNEVAYQRAVHFVNETKPTEPVVEDVADGNAAEKTGGKDDKKEGAKV